MEVRREIRRRAVVLVLGVVGVVGVVGASVVGAAAEPAPGPAAGIEVMAWLAGHWRGPAFDGVGEEAWLPPADGAMVGSYRYVGPDGVGFYELLVIREVEGSLVLQLKHFTPALHGWEAPEETVDFPLVAVSGDEVRFDGMRFVRRGDDAMTVHLRLDDDGASRVVRFDYSRVD